MRTRVLFPPFLGALFMGFLLGCGDSTKATLKGKATVNGQPFAGTIYVINLETKEQDGSQTSEKDGSFHIHNAPLGKVKIYVKPITIPGLGQNMLPLPPLPPGQKPPINARLPGVLPPKDAPPEAFPPEMALFAHNPALRDAAEISVKVETQFRFPKESPLETEIKLGRNTFDLDLKAGDEIPSKVRKPPSN